MRVESIHYFNNTNNQKQQNSINFGAINPRYLKEAKEEFEIMKTVSGDLIEKLQCDILTKKLNKEDGIDTVKALYPYTKKKYHWILDSLLNMHCLKSKADFGN